MRTDRSKPHLSTKSGIFDADAPSGVRTDLVLYGKSVESIIVNGKKLTGGLDYSTSGSQIMLNESWLKTLANGNYTLYIHIRRRKHRYICTHCQEC